MYCTISDLNFCTVKREAYSLPCGTGRLSHLFLIYHNMMLIFPLLVSHELVFSKVVNPLVYQKQKLYKTCFLLSDWWIWSIGN